MSLQPNDSDNPTIKAVKSFFANDQVQVVLKGAVASSGVIYTTLVNQGLSPDQVGLVTTLLINFGPALVVGIVELLLRTKAAIVNKAAQILADKQSGRIIVNTQTAQPSLVALTASATTPNVVAQTGNHDLDVLAAAAAVPGVSNITVSASSNPSIGALAAAASSAFPTVTAGV